MIRVGVDVGGTFTDVVLRDETSGSTSWLKVLTNDLRPADGVLDALAASGVPCADIAQLRLGTTLGVNAVLTRTGAPTGLITTAGFRDVLEIRRTHRRSLFDLNERIPDPLVPRDLRLEVAERLDADGNVVTPLDESGVRAAWRTLREAGVTSLAIVFLFSFENPAHERRARDIVLREGGAEVVFISSEVLPLHREYERSSTTVMAAYVATAMQRHIAELDERLQDQGAPAGGLSIMTGSGGVQSADAIAHNPIPSLLSGPAGGVTGARRLAGEAGISDVLTLDMGGTSCDVSGLVAGVADERLDMDIDGLAVSCPSYDIHTIGAGGGSIAWIDSGGALRVGPRSAGSRPGPACYGLGGHEPTVTDANLLLGRYDPSVPLGGAVRLDRASAREAISRRIAEPLGLSAEEAAAGIVAIVGAHMAGAVRTISVERGRDVRDFTLVAFGGAGPVHAADVARELGIDRILVPPCPGCTSAFGALVSSPRHDLMRTLARRAADVPKRLLRATVGELRAQAEAALAREGLSPAGSTLELWLDLRYAGQAHELAVRSPSLEDPELAQAVAAFHSLHEQLYGHSFADVTVELVNVRVTGHGPAAGSTSRWDWSHAGARAGPPELGTVARRPVYFLQAGGFLDTLVLRRERIGPGESVEGPAVIHQVDSTLLIPPALTAVAHVSGGMILSVGQSPVRPSPRPRSGAAVTGARGDARGGDAWSGDARGGGDRGAAMTGLPDAVTVEIIRHALVSASREMGATLRLTSCSPIFNEGNDYSCAIFDAGGRLISHGEFLPIHLGSLSFSVSSAREAFASEGLKEGDTVLMNDPYRGGSHLPDLTMVSPIFHGGELVAFAANRAHHLDIGGAVPGSFYPRATDNYQEGLRISPVKLFRAGVRDTHLLRLITGNSRLPAQMRIDLESQVSANRTAGKRVAQLLDRYGVEVVRRAMGELLNHSERRMRAVIAGWPDGDYTASDWLDNDGITDVRLEIRVTLRVRGDRIEVDFTGSSEQVAGPLNSVLGYTLSGVYMTLQSATDPDIHPNAGCYRPVAIVAPAGSIVNPCFPAPCTGGNETVFVISNAIFRALAQIPGARVMACDQGSSNNLLISGRDPRDGQRYVLYEYPEGGWGGNRDRDGLSAVFSIAGNTWNVPVEVVERRFPVRVERYELRTDSGGPGAHRGGLGIRRDHRVLGHDAEVTLLGNRVRVPPWGYDGGGDGAPAGYLLLRAGDLRPLAPELGSKATGIHLHDGDVVVQLTAGGGGWGEARVRDRHSVERDVRLGYVSREAARRDYGTKNDNRH
jgi:N-methylhydantoinase A/oxoprolinase/acetone carboxylase beta subunit/N-methylhydantoinase B/oxoprolinase/acetone carboxylase alpha subunit